jgi:hypothetical protein
MAPVLRKVCQCLSGKCPESIEKQQQIENRRMKRFLTTTALGALLAAPAFAVPDLQLDVQGGTYVGGTDETIYSDGPIFDLYALIQPSGSTPLSGNYRLSVALTPALAESFPAPDFGSFAVTLNGVTTTYSSTQNTSFGTPTLEATLQAQDLADHGAFPTYFGEYSFNFNSANTIQTYDIQTNGGDPASSVGVANSNSNQAQSYYALFGIDVSGLADGYNVHFDLYEVNADGSVGTFAPFSHDAQSGPGEEVPDAGTTLVPLGGSLIGLGALRRRFSK